MNNEVINAAIAALSSEIAARQDCITALSRLKSDDGPDGSQGLAPRRNAPELDLRQVRVRAESELGRRVGRKARVTNSPARSKRGPYKKRGAKEDSDTAADHAPESSSPRGGATSAVAMLDKPDTLGGAMKLVMREFKGPFDFDKVMEKVNADPDWAKIVANGNPASAKANWNYWLRGGNITECPGGFKIGTGWGAS